MKPIAHRLSFLGAGHLFKHLVNAQRDADKLVVFTPKHPPKDGEPVQYHCYDSCNKCGDVNDLRMTLHDERGIYETGTKCRKCGHEDHWAYGFFESGCETESKCKTYSFGGSE